ncbi:MAG: hypothetical protein ACHQ53_10445 [Polyangiales bacterium]
MKQRTSLAVLGLALLALAASTAWLSRPGPPTALAPERPSPSLPAAAQTAGAGAQAPRSGQTEKPATASQGPAAKLTAGQALREVQSLVAQAKIGAARDLAEAYLKRIPDGPEAAQIKSLTGVHPHR